ncbi:Uncharacterized protein OBRU01_26384 [Operophtera brumata]|uniref:Uncharacterized protein n=1 Tax=Operophtera brumata TaxID=104452 RepID=A0A0L7K3D0_OPEBR|nr:Uncharacterized protein OBRU01_26384 [Operophtera brumata]
MSSPEINCNCFVAILLHLSLRRQRHTPADTRARRRDAGGAECVQHGAGGAPGPGFDIVPVLLLQPRLPAVLEALCALQQGTTLRAVCERHGAVGAPGPGFDIVPVLLLQPRLPAVLEALCALQQGTTLRAVCERHAAVGAPGPGFDIVPVLLLQPRLPAVLEALCALQQGTTLRAVCERHGAVGAPGPGFDIRRLVVFAQVHDLIKCLKRCARFFFHTTTHKNTHPPTDSHTHTNTQHKTTHTPLFEEMLRLKLKRLKNSITDHIFMGRGEGEGFPPYAIPIPR